MLELEGSAKVDEGQPNQREGITTALTCYKTQAKARLEPRGSHYGLSNVVDKHLAHSDK